LIPGLRFLEKKPIERRNSKKQKQWPADIAKSEDRKNAGNKI
jgi:hypothetical protein